MAWFINKILTCLVTGLIVSGVAIARDDPPTPLSKQVSALTGDWIAEDWDENRLKLHPDMYTWQSDIHVTLYPEEPHAGRSALQAARLHFDRYSLDDDTLDPTLVSMDGAKEMMDGILAVKYRWSYAFDENMSVFGVVTTPSGNYVPFNANCELDREDFKAEHHYRYDECVRKMAIILANLSGFQGSQLTLPSPPSPLTVPGWDSQYLPSGVAVAVRANHNGLRVATIMVTPPQTLSQTNTRDAIQTFSSSLIDDSDREHMNAGSIRWVGASTDPWIRREFPEAYDGPSIIMAGSVKTPQGKVSLVGVRCPNENWLETCSYAVEVARQQVSAGIVEQRRTSIVAATQKALPKNGLKSADVYGIYTQGRNTMGYGGFMTGYTVDGPLLLKDGTACTCFEGPLGAIIPADSRRANPDDWGKWRKNGRTITLNWPDDQDEIEITNENFMTGGDRTTRVEGEYKFVAGGGAIGSNSGWLQQSYFTFRKDGTFSTDQSSAYSVSTGNPIEPDATITGGSSGGGSLGRYEIDGYNLKLTYPDGRAQYRGFAQYAHEAKKTRKDAVMIDGTVYFRQTGD